MKKVILIATAAVFVLGLASCKKDYDCVCTEASLSTTYTYEKVTKADAEALCDSQNVSWTIIGGSCSLK